MDLAAHLPSRSPWDGISLHWETDPDPSNWDEAIAALGGHPLQSHAWGTMRRGIDGIEQHRLMASANDQVLWMMRIETRALPGGNKIAWAPRGPNANCLARIFDWPPGLGARLRSLGFSLLIAEPQMPAIETASRRPRPRQTIFVDLTCGEAELLARAGKKWRNGVRRAEKEGICVRTTSSEEDIERAWALCNAIASTKSFLIPLSSAKMKFLLEHSTAAVKASLYLAEYNGQLAATAFVMRSGSSLHYMMGGTSREVSTAWAGEAIQWRIMRDGALSGAARYDLEGIDPVRNPSTAAFKQKLGGVIVSLAPVQYLPLDTAGRIAARAHRAQRWLAG